MKFEESTGGVILNNGRIAIVLQKKSNSWSLPKGHIDEGESKIETAKREIYEETGLTELEFIKELGSYTRGTKKDPSISKKLTFFLFKTTQTLLEPKDKDNPQAIWLPIEEVAEKLSYEKDKDFFLSIIEEIK